MTDVVVVAAWGGGVNSTAMILEWLRRAEPLHYVLFADTGGEKPATYAYRDRFLAWLGTHGVHVFTVRANRADPTLEAECLRKQVLPSLAYGYKKCSLAWKRQPQDKFLRHQPAAIQVWAAGDLCTKLIGFDADEERRAKMADDLEYHYRYPLIEWGWGREQCIAGIRAAGWDVPPKSSCFFCPAMTVGDIQKLGDEHPDLLQRALAIEDRALPNLRSRAGLGGRLNWRAVAEQDRRQLRFTWPQPIACDCYDGGPEDDDA